MFYQFLRLLINIKRRDVPIVTTNILANGYERIETNIGREGTGAPPNHFLPVWDVGC